MVVFRLVLTNGMVLTQGDWWPGPDGKPLMLPKEGGKQDYAGKVLMIAFVPDLIENVEDEDGNPIGETNPAHYEVLMCGKDGGGIKNAAGDEETQIYTIYTSQVLFVGKMAGWREACQHFSELIAASGANGASKQLIPVEKPAVQPQAQAT